MGIHPRLDALFAGDANRLRALAEPDIYGSVLGAADHLLEDARSLGIEGVEKLRLAGGIEKLEALLSELRIGNMFARLGFNVAVLADEEFGRDVYTPDLRVTRNDLEIPVEVLHGSDGGPDMIGPLDRALKASKLAFRLEDYPAESLSVPGITYHERAEAEQVVKKVVPQIIAHLRAVDPGQEGSLTIDGHRFEYGPSPDDQGYAAGGVTTAHSLRTEEHAKKLLTDLERKANKQSRLPHWARTLPFIVAYDNRESELDATTVLSALTGSRTALAESRPQVREHWKRNNPVVHPPQVEAALNGSWGDLLKGWDFGLDSEVRIRKYGALVESAWASSLSGVVLTHIHDWVQWFPNPFASPELLEPRLLDLGLPLRGLEPHHPAWHRYP